MAPLRADIAAAKEHIFSPFTLGANREIRKLVNYLQSGETVSYICPGEYEENRGIVVVTNERVIFIKDTILEKTNQDFIFRSITSIEFIMRIVYGDIKLSSTSFKDVYISKVPRNNGLAMVKLIREGIRNNGLPLYDFNQPSPSPQLPSTPSAPTIPTTTPSSLSLAPSAPVAAVEALPAVTPVVPHTSATYQPLPVPVLDNPEPVQETIQQVSDPLAGLSDTERQMILDSRAKPQNVAPEASAVNVPAAGSAVPSKEEQLADLQRKYDNEEVDANFFLKEKSRINKMV